ncbi:MAG: diacylglycerol kinase family protein [Thermodesulfobacteriota bacterium]
MSGIGLIFNPYAGKNKKNPRLEDELRGILGDHGQFVRTDDKESLVRAVQDFHKKNVDIIAVSGGDGTLHQVISVLAEVYGDQPLPKFGFLRCGTMNTVSKSIKFKGKSTEILGHIVKTHVAGGSFGYFDQPTMRVNDRYGFMTGAGVVARFLQVYYSAKKPGPVHAAGMVAQMIFSAVCRTGYNRKIFSPIKCRMTVDGREIPQDEYLYILACTIRELGLGFTPTPRAYEKPGHFHLFAGAVTPAGLVPKVPAIWLGRDFTHPKLYYNGIAAEMTLEPLEPIPWMIDGDVYSTDQPLRFSVGPTISLIVS